MRTSGRGMGRGARAVDTRGRSWPSGTLSSMFTFSNPGQFFGPAEALALYRSLPVSTPDGTVTVSVTSYRNANHTDDASGCVASLALKEALRQADGAAVARAGGAQNFVDVFTGKGSPGGIVSV